MKIRTNDTVRILSGKDKGKTGKVLQVFPKWNRVVVEGVNQSTRHLRGKGTQPGQKVSFDAPVHISNVAVVGKTLTSGRVGYKVLKTDGKVTKVRVLKKGGKSEDLT